MSTTPRIDALKYTLVVDTQEGPNSNLDIDIDDKYEYGYRDNSDNDNDNYNDNYNDKERDTVWTKKIWLHLYNNNIKDKRKEDFNKFYLWYYYTWINTTNTFSISINIQYTIISLFNLIYFSIQFILFLMEHILQIILCFSS